MKFTISKKFYLNLFLFKNYFQRILKIIPEKLVWNKKRLKEIIMVVLFEADRSRYLHKTCLKMHNEKKSRPKKNLI